MPVWAPLQLAWVNNVYRTFHDYEKFMIIMQFIDLRHLKLTQKTL